MRVEEFLHDEQLESMAIQFDRSALATATTATYVIHQDVTYTYDRPVADLRQRLVVVPRRQHGDQRRVAHRFDVASAAGSSVRAQTDRFGNSVVHVDVPSVASHIEFKARAVVRRNRQTVSQPAWTAQQPTTTALTAPDDAIVAAVAHLRDVGDHTHTADRVSDLVHGAFQYRHDVTSVRTTAAQAWQIGQGVCQDMAHVMIAMCASLGVSTRYVSGHLVGDGASHAWVEVYDPARRMVVAVDPTHARRADLRYVTTATGRDYRDVAPTTGTYVSKGGHGHLSVRKKIRLTELA